MPLSPEELAKVHKLIGRAEDLLRKLDFSTPQYAALKKYIDALKWNTSAFMVTTSEIQIRSYVKILEPFLELDTFPGTPRGRPRFASLADLQPPVPALCLTGSNPTGPFKFELPDALKGQEKNPLYWWSSIDDLSRPTGLFDFVVVGSSNTGERILLVPKDSGHTAITDGGLVIFAGVISLVAGVLQYWTNSSGHYQPAEAAHFGIGHLLDPSKFSGH